MPRPAALVLAVAAALALAGGQGGAIAQSRGGIAQAGGAAETGATTAKLTVAEARTAANRILKAVQTRDPQLRYSQFSPALQAISSTELVAERIRSEPRLRGWTLLSVRGGLGGTTVEASLDTAEGPLDLFMVLDASGQLEAYHVDLTDAEPSRVAGDFVKALGANQFVTAQSFLSLPMQQQFSAASLRAKWQQLQRETGDFQEVRRVVEADSDDQAQLVLVFSDFERTTDSLFVILNTNNEIVGVNFPQDPNRPRRFADDGSAGGGSTGGDAQDAEP